MLIDCLSLVKHGVPYDVAFSLSPAKRIAYLVALGEMEGRRFDWSTLTWHPQK